MQQCNTSLAYPHSYKLCRQNNNYSPPWLYSYCFPYISFFPHLERFPSWNIPGWDSGLAEWERLGRKHSDEEKPPKAVQGTWNTTWDVYNFYFYVFQFWETFSYIIFIFLSLQGSVFICFDTEESAKQFLERTDIKSFKDNEMLVLSR